MDRQGYRSAFGSAFGAVALVCLSVLVLAGCASAPSKDTYLDRGDAICKQTAAAAAKVTLPRKGNLPATATYLRTSADLIDAELHKLRKLSRPSGERRAARGSAVAPG